ncbi:DUF1194 domain-containing protein [Palleronia sp. KMU-117]|uniref:DUF1194 domain-containing protein n=1 Tax=Palleronia sp. KMU-117 TaxID=3434108 RepID=UPI003D75FBCD
MLTARTFVAAIALGGAAPAAATCADVALVLALDASGSVKDDEYFLQQQGYARAFRSPGVRAALANAGIVDIGAVVFSDSVRDLQIMPMTRLVRGAGADDLARHLETIPRPVRGNTGIGNAIAAATRLLDAPGVCAYRRIINLSGDGPESMAPRKRTAVSTADARLRAEALGITINALAIAREVPDLGEWYRTRLIAGPGAFVMEVESFESFAAAIEIKLLREIRPETLAALQFGH